MSKMIDIFEQDYVQNFSYFLTIQADQIEHQLHQFIQNASNQDLKIMIDRFFSQPMSLDIAYSLDISQTEIELLRSGQSLKTEQVESATKVIAYLIAEETDSFSQIDIFDSLVDYPM